MTWEDEKYELIAYIEANPGLRKAELCKALGIREHDWPRLRGYIEGEVYRTAVNTYHGADYVAEYQAAHRRRYIRSTEINALKKELLALVKNHPLGPGEAIANSHEKRFTWMHRISVIGDRLKELETEEEETEAPDIPPTRIELLREGSGE